MCLSKLKFRELHLTHQSVSVDQSNSWDRNTQFFLKVFHSKWAAETFTQRSPSVSWWITKSWLHSCLIYSCVSTHVLCRGTNRKIPHELKCGACSCRRRTKAFTDNWIKWCDDKRMLQTLKSFIYSFDSTAQLSNTFLIHNTMFMNW